MTAYPRLWLAELMPLSYGVPVPAALTDLVEEVADRLTGRPQLQRVLRATVLDTWTRAAQRDEDGVFVSTGDIPAMWLRDAAASVRPYLVLAGRDEQVRDFLAGVLRRQVAFMLHDPYANAFNRVPGGSIWAGDQTAMTPQVWERKYEIDSLAWPLELAWSLWRATGSADHLDGEFATAARLAVLTWGRERDHEGQSGYRFTRPGSAHESLARDGLGTPVAPTGMSWTGFRPSDDLPTYGYSIPGNAFACVALEHLAELADGPLHDPELAGSARDLASGLRQGIADHGVVRDPALGELWAYEVDGLGGRVLMDDANPPSLLALPWIGWCAADEPRYLATRELVLSDRNPYWYAGSAASGVGSPHYDPPGFVWPFGLCLQGLTSRSADERLELLDVLASTTGGTDLMHDAFGADNPTVFFRPWFTWANSLFAELVLDCCGIRVPGSRLAVPCCSEKAATAHAGARNAV